MGYHSCADASISWFYHFGIPADKYGRKWPFVINCLVFIATQLGTGFVTTYNQFLGVRALWVSLWVVFMVMLLLLLWKIVLPSVVVLFPVCSNLVTHSDIFFVLFLTRH